MTKAASQSITGVVLAGGTARRMGGVDKGLISIAGRQLIEYILDTLRPQVSDIVINANRHHEAYARFGFPVVADREFPSCGPLAGLLTGLLAAKTDWILSVPCDSPLIPADLAPRMRRARKTGTRLCVVHDGERLQPVFTLLHRQLLPSLREYLAAGGRKTDEWVMNHSPHLVDYSDRRKLFININERADIETAERILTETRA